MGCATSRETSTGQRLCLWNCPSNFIKCKTNIFSWFNTLHNLICLKKNKKKVNINEIRKESVNRVRSRTLVASRLCLSLAQTHSTFHSFIHSYVRSYFDVIKWKPYKNWVAPVTSSHIAGRRVIIHSILFLFSCFFFPLLFFIERVNLNEKNSSSSSRSQQQQQDMPRHTQLTNR